MAEEKKKSRGSTWLRETRGELKKVTWPNRELVMKNTGTVLLCSLLIGACIWIFDFAATNLVKMILAVFGG
ncbi:MAG: preprotein translocase subunit SecE [Oscillibacter sp.]|nr:preprotein translocase subunit SecE [Oscillibacter sp.]